MQKTRKAYPLTGTPYLIKQIRHKFANFLHYKFSATWNDTWPELNIQLSHEGGGGGGGGVNSGGRIYTETQGVEVYI